MTLRWAVAREWPQLLRTRPVRLPTTCRGRRPFGIPGGLDAGGGVTVDRDDVPFNTCDAESIGTYETLIHEAGHALGIRNASSVASGWHRNLWHHPSTYESLMSYEGIVLRTGLSASQLPDDPDCSPHPLDVLAIFALYQQDSNP